MPVEFWKDPSIPYVKRYHTSKLSWPWPNLRDHKGDRKITIELIQVIEVVNIVVKFCKDASISLRVIALTW